MTPALQAAVAELFASQHALASRIQLLERGVDDTDYLLQLRRGAWREVCRDVVQVAGAPPTWHQGPMAATLASPHVAISVGTALRLQQLDGYLDDEALVLIAPRGTKPRMPAGATLTTTRRLGALDIVTVEGIRATNIATSLVHAVRSGPNGAASRALDDALRRGASPGWFAATVERWRGGVAGAQVLQHMLDERAGRRLPRSWFERMAKTALGEHGITLEHEYPIHDGRRIIARLDLADPVSQSGIECQSWRWHSTPAAQANDVQRKRRVRQLGWDFAECWWSDLDRMDAVAADFLLIDERQRRILDLPRRAG